MSEKNDDGLPATRGDITESYLTIGRMAEAMFAALADLHMRAWAPVLRPAVGGQSPVSLEGDK